MAKRVHQLSMLEEFISEWKNVQIVPFVERDLDIKLLSRDQKYSNRKWLTLKKLYWLSPYVFCCIGFRGCCYVEILFYSWPVIAWTRSIFQIMTFRQCQKCYLQVDSLFQLHASVPVIRATVWSHSFTVMLPVCQFNSVSDVVYSVRLWYGRCSWCHVFSSLWDSFSRDRRWSFFVCVCFRLLSRFFIYRASSIVLLVLGAILGMNLVLIR